MGKKRSGVYDIKPDPRREGVPFTEAEATCVLRAIAGLYLRRLEQMGCTAEYTIVKEGEPCLNK